MTALRWESEEFRDEVLDLVEATVGTPTSLEPVHVRSWSTVWRAVTSEGTWFVKENCVEQSHEPRLLAAIEEVAPGRVVPVVAARGGLFLMPHQGPPLGASIGNDIEGWCRVVVAHAELQRALLPHVDRLGLVALPPRAAPAWAAATADRLAGLPPGDPRRLVEEDAEKVRAVLPSVAVWADEVASLDLPVTLVHNDLHANNVFDVGGRIQIFDLGDAVVMEPLAGLLIPLNVLSHTLGAGPDDPRLVRVADAALEVWSDRVGIDELRAALPAALQLARLGRVESWERVARSMDAAALQEHGDSAAAWLGTLALEPPVGHLRAR